jgi:hypothetical protein
MRPIIGVVVLSLVVLLGFEASAAFAQSRRPVLAISVMDLTTGQLVLQGRPIPSGHQVQVTVAASGGDCAGQYVVSALGAPGNPPAVLVQFAPFIMQPAGGTTAITGDVMTLGVVPGGGNDFKISASCNGASPTHFAFSHFEFFVE